MHLTNSFGLRKEEFKPRDGHVGMYVCGVTPYDTTHAGHAFTYISFDVLIRYLRYQGVRVTYVQNVTDIDDDILRKAKLVGMTWLELGQSETARFRQDMDALNWMAPDHYPLATQEVPGILRIATGLISKGYAYVKDGSVYFEARKDPEFGQLAGLGYDEALAIANERGNFPDDPKKRDPLDFVLWQAAQPGEPTWESPWGPGRPGWHIECSAMSTHYLGDIVDIHGGGSDLLFPHHSCEISQTEHYSGVKPFVRCWMHTAMVQLDGVKMSKSLGNLVMAREVLGRASSDAMRLYLSSHHYRQVWDWREPEFAEAIGWARAIAAAATGTDSAAGKPEFDASSYRSRFINALEDDLATPAAIQTLRELADTIDSSRATRDVGSARATLIDLGGRVMGLTFKP
ncbi:MAG: cysteine--tRNA ligase [Chloroflexota bacterium]|nr:MAG: cysteine--tRNA ligase [Chloroflexota bacterium]